MHDSRRCVGVVAACGFFSRVTYVTGALEWKCYDPNASGVYVRLAFCVVSQRNAAPSCRGWLNLQLWMPSSFFFPVSHFIIVHDLHLSVLFLCKGELCVGEKFSKKNCQQYRALFFLLHHIGNIYLTSKHKETDPKYLVNPVQKLNRVLSFSG